MGKSPWIPKSEFAKLCRIRLAALSEPGQRTRETIEFPCLFKRAFLPERGRRVPPHPTLEDYDDA